RRTIAAKIRQSLSSSKSQWDMLFGSFQNITESIMGGVHRSWFEVGEGGVAADEDLGLGMGHDGEAGAAQHRFDRRAIRDPPVGLVAGILVLDEMQFRVPRRVEHSPFRKR